MKKIVVIGSEGLVGKQFQQLYASQYDIICIGKNNSIDAIAEDASIDAVVFLAQSEEYKLGYFTQKLFEVNVQLLHKALLQFSNTNTKFIYFSSGSVYKNNNTALEIDSALDYTSSNAYVISKIQGEQLVQTFVSKYQSVHVVRPFFIYGKGQSKQMLFSVMIDKVNNQEAISMNSSNGLIFNPVHCEDAANFIQ
jgi:UDP-glucose 4-epimerase